MKLITELKKQEYEIFKGLWDMVADRLQWFELAVSLNNEITPEEWDHAWQHCTINHPNLKQAQREFLLAINQTY